MSHPELLLQKFAKTGVQGAKLPCRGVRGSAPQCPHKLFLPLLRVAGGDARGEKELCGDTPHPGLGPPPCAIPLLKRLERNRTSVRKVRDDSCQ